MDEFEQPEIQITSVSGNVVLSLMTEKQLNYRAEWSADLEKPNWQLLPEGLFKGDGDLMSIPDTLAGNEERFYRVIMLNK